MNITLTNIKISKQLSEETTAFTAILVVDGKRVAHVSNHGTGGSNDYYPVAGGSYEAIRAVQAYCKTLPPVPCPTEWNCGPLTCDLDLVVDKLLDAYEEEKQLRRWCKNKIVFTLPGDKEGEYRTCNRPWDPAIKERFLAKYPGATIINERFPVDRAAAVAHTLGVTKAQVQAQQAKNLLQLQRMYEQAKASGQKVNGFTADELLAMVNKAAA